MDKEVLLAAIAVFASLVAVVVWLAKFLASKLDFFMLENSKREANYQAVIATLSITTNTELPALRKEIERLRPLLEDKVGRH